MYVFIDEAGDTGFKLGKGSSDYFILAAVVFETNASIIEANRLIEELKNDCGFDQNYEFHFHLNHRNVRVKFLEVISEMSFYWSSICIDKVKIKSDRMKQSDYLTKKVSSYLCNHHIDSLDNAVLIFDKRDGKKFYNTLSKQMRLDFNQSKKTIKKIKAKDSKKDPLLQVADYCAGVANQMMRKPKYGNELFS